MRALPSGPISIPVAIDHLTLALGVHPLDDIAIVMWASERRALMQMLASGNATRVTLGEPPQLGRPNETRMDTANALLLRAHPQLAHAPLHFAVLEALHGLDIHDAVRFPSPGTWRDSPKLAMNRRHSVRTRAHMRIQRALAINLAPLVESASNIVGVDYSAPSPSE